MLFFQRGYCLQGPLFLGYLVVQFRSRARNLSSDVLLTALRTLHKATQKIQGKMGGRRKRCVESEKLFGLFLTFLESHFVLTVV